MVASKFTTPAESPTSASVMPAASAPAANKPSSFPTSSTPQMAPAAPVSSFDLPTIQLLPQPPTTTTTAPISFIVFWPYACTLLLTVPASASTNPSLHLRHQARKPTNRHRSPSQKESLASEFTTEVPVQLAHIRISIWFWWTLEAPKPKGAETERPRLFVWTALRWFSIWLYRCFMAPKPNAELPGTSAFATAISSGGDAKKADAPLSIFGAADAAKKDGSRAGASAPAVFGDFGANTSGVSSNIFEKSSAPQLSGDASTSTSTPKSHEAVTINAPPSSNTTCSILSFGRKEDTTVPSPSGTSASTASESSTPVFAFGSSVFSQPSTDTSNGPMQQQSVFRTPSVPMPSAVGFGRDCKQHIRLRKSTRRPVISRANEALE
ncbi:hypothetical protein DFJ58DRAFT_836619 [Suillus subalutaceus]|uniref:uncharacterized protein n=1 Tax=Suillus subalutaceus TaxID=48586 RepID=UPI001B875333|nr:uncharacterized protein DFJ58DRAFT_836619 [Suillus subalutaceus]KAG1873643.1 hypothetical protein DFJ58DRAFT_836619 [Suillus subalutaceus]